MNTEGANAQQHSITMLLVDDDENIIKSLLRLFRKLPVTLLAAKNGESAQEIFAQKHIDILLSDMKMPGMSGAELTQWVANNHPDCFRIILTGYSELNSAIDAINLGKVHRFIQKPWDNKTLLEAVQEGVKSLLVKHENLRLNALVEEKNKALQLANDELEDKVEHRTRQIRLALKKIQQEHKATDQLLYNFISIHPELSGEFAIKVSKLAKGIAAKLNLDESHVEQIKLAALLCEVGQLGLNRELITAPFDQLNMNDREAFFEQIEIASSLLLPATHLYPVVDIITQQFEHWDGSGYPRIAQGEDIAVGARIIAVARDFWRYVDGKISGEQCTYEQSIAMLKKNAKVKYDSNVLAILCADTEQLITNRFGKRISSNQLRPGMVLFSGVFSEQALLVLPEGHEFTESSIATLRKYEQGLGETLTIDVHDSNL